MARRGRLSIRRATLADIPACGRIWRTSLDDYLGRLNQPAIQAEPEGLARLHAHALRTDPRRFLVAVRRPATDDRASAEPSRPEAAPPDSGGRVVAFVSALDRGPL